MTRISVSHARQTLRERIKRVEAGEEIEAARNGHVVAALTSSKALKRRRPLKAFDRAQELQDRLAKAGSKPLKSGTLDPERADSLVRETREDRGSR